MELLISLLLTLGFIYTKDDKANISYFATEKNLSLDQDKLKQALVEQKEDWQVWQKENSIIIIDKDDLMSN